MPKRVLEIGSGPDTQAPYYYISEHRPIVYISIDRRHFPNVDVQVNLDDGLPFKNEVFDGIFSAHCFEHLAFATAYQLLREAYRVLRPGGTMKMFLPNFAYWVRRYQKEGWTEAVWTNIFGQQKYPWDFHLSGWDPDSLVAACTKVGFRSTAIQGRMPDEMLIFSIRQEGT